MYDYVSMLHPILRKKWFNLRNYMYRLRVLVLVLPLQNTHRQKIQVRKDTQTAEFLWFDP